MGRCGRRNKHHFNECGWHHLDRQRSQRCFHKGAWRSLWHRNMGRGGRRHKHHCVFIQWNCMDRSWQNHFHYGSQQCGVEWVFVRGSGSRRKYRRVFRKWSNLVRGHGNHVCNLWFRHSMVKWKLDCSWVRRHELLPWFSGWANMDGSRQRREYHRSGRSYRKHIYKQGQICNNGRKHK